MIHRQVTFPGLVAGTVLTLALSACDPPGTDLGRYYEVAFTDHVRIAAREGTTYVLIEQDGLAWLSLSSEPMVDVRPNPALSDSVWLTLSVRGGAYEQPPVPRVEIGLRGDTVVIHYAMRHPTFTAPQGEAAQKTTPHDSYLAVEAIVAEHPAGRPAVVASRPSG